MYVHADEQCLQRWFENGPLAIEASDAAISAFQHTFIRYVLYHLLFLASPTLGQCLCKLCKAHIKSYF